MSKINLTVVRLLVVALILILISLRSLEVPFSFISMWLLYLPLIGVLVWRDFLDEQIKNNPLFLVLGIFANSLFVTSLYFTYLGYAGADIFRWTTGITLLLIVVIATVKPVSAGYALNCYLFFAMFGALTFLLKY